MSNQPVIVPGIVSPVRVTVNMWTGKHTVLVGDQLATGTGKGTYALRLPTERSKERSV
jgi:hypothetical protein